MRKITCLLAAMAVGVWAFAQPMSGTYKVGVTDPASDYASLSAAVAAINTNGVGGNIVLEITSDITEPANIGLGVNTNGFGITIRPDADADRTITFTQLADNTSPTGHFVIGYPTSGLTVAWSDDNTIGTSNVTIDGYAVGGTTRRLTFTNTNAAHVGARVIVVVGASNNVTIKNCIVDNKTTNTSSPFCVGAVVRKGTAIEVGPANLTIENNQLTALGNNVAMGVRITNSGTLTTVKAENLVFRNNTVTARRRLVEINYVNNAEISGNEFTTEQTGAAGTISYGLWTSAGVTGTVNIFNNKFVKALTEETGAFGHRVVSLSSGATYNIYNNMFAGINKTKASTVATNLVYLFYSGVAGKIYNNTFYMPQLSDASGTGYYSAIQLSGNTAEIKNNIFISDVETHGNPYFISAVPTPASDYNIFHMRHSVATHKVVGTFTSLTDYVTANPAKDVNSKNVNVNFVDVATGNLLLTGTSLNDANLEVPRLPEVLKDILGFDRGVTTYAGAHQPDLTSSTPEVQVSHRIMRTSTGVMIELDRESVVEIYGMNGVMVDKTRTSGTYSRDLNQGIYIIRIDGQATKFIK